MSRRASKACQARAKANRWNRPSRPNQLLDAFLKPRVPLNPPTVSAPLPVHPVEVGTISEAPADFELEALDEACTEAHHLEAAGRKAKPRASRLLTQQQGNPSFTPRLGGTSAKRDQTKDQVPTYESEREPLKDASATRIK